MLLYFRGVWDSSESSVESYVVIHSADGPHVGDVRPLRDDDREPAGDHPGRTNAEDKAAIITTAEKLWQAHGALEPGDVADALEQQGLSRPTPGSLRGIVRIWRAAKGLCHSRSARKITWSEEFAAYVQRHNEESREMKFPRCVVGPVITRFVVFSRKLWSFYCR